MTQADAATQTTWNSNDRQAQSLISLFIHQDMQHLQKDAYVAAGGVAHPSLAKDLWDQLAALYAPTGLQASMKPSHRLLAFGSLIWVTTLTAADLMICQLQSHLRSML